MENLIKLLSKFSKYELLNNLIPGVVLSYILTTIGYHVWVDNWMVNTFVSYFVGMICSRFSSRKKPVTLTFNTKEEAVAALKEANRKAMRKDINIDSLMPHIWHK